MIIIDGTIALSELKRMAAINIRPSQGNRSRGVDAQATRAKIIELVERLIAP